MGSDAAMRFRADPLMTTVLKQFPPREGMSRSGIPVGSFSIAHGCRSGYQLPPVMIITGPPKLLGTEVPDPTVRISAGVYGWLCRYT